ncbi:MAG: hypothetical protein ACUVT6_12650 [Thermodesulfobacteriota bacterium]
MARVNIFFNSIIIFLIVFHLALIPQVNAQPTGQPLLVPGLILGLRHNMNQERISSNIYMVFFSAPPGAPVTRMYGGDFGAPLHRGYEWWMVNDNPSADPNSYVLPPGIPFALKHNKNQGNQKNIALFGRDPITGPVKFSRFKKYAGGDLGGGTHAGDGYYWYESTGEGFSNWGIIGNLPRYTVVGLKHSRNQRDKVFVWEGKKYDPVNPSIPPPSGFVRVFGGDRGASAGEGYYWYEKVTGSEVVSIPNLTARLGRSLLFGPTDPQNADLDRDGLLDMLEGELAMIFSPHLIFDSDEKARKPHEPVVLFQVRPLDLRSLVRQITIKWVFLFRRDGGYGPSSSCRDAHDGDNDDAYYEVTSRDHGRTWTITKIKLSFKDLEWPRTSRLEVDELTHPIIYMSAHKHHMYFTKDWDGKDSIYSDWDCNDDVNGQGSRVRADVISFRRANPQILYNNVGEPESHPSPPFVNDLSYFYSGQSAWQDKNFYGAGNIKTKWMTFRWK